MLKGQSHTDMNIMGGSAIFFIVAIAIFTALIAPIVYQYLTVGSTENEIKAVEFSNLARTVLLGAFGDGKGNILYSLLLSGAANGTEGIGLPDNYLQVDNVYTDEYVKIGDNGGRFEHDSFSTIKSFQKNVDGRNDVVMEAGKEYLVHSYRIVATGSVAVDIYTDFVCSVDGGDGGYRIVECGETDGLETLLADIESLKSTIIAPVVNGVEDSAIVRMMAQDDVTAKDLVVSGSKLGSTAECLEKDGRTCFRIVGSFVFPARIHTEIGKDSSIGVSMGSEGAQ